MRFAVAGVLLAACAEPSTVALQLHVQPEAIVFRRDGDTTWSAVPETSHSERSAIYAVPDENGTLAIACTWPDGTVQLEELLATAGEFGSAFYAPLEPWPQLDCGPAAPPAALVAGNMVQGGEIYIGAAEFEGFSQWAFAGPVAAGVHDLVAMSADTVLVRHDQAMLSTYLEPPIDITQGIGLAMQYLEDKNGTPVGALDTELVTVNGTRLDLYSAWTGEAYVVPDSELEPGDTQVVYASFGNTSEGIYLPPLDGLHDLVSPTVNAPIQFDPVKLAADLSPLSLDGAVSQVHLVYYDTGAQQLELAATATPRWLALHGPQLAIDTSFPDFRWTVGASPSPQLLALDSAPTAVLVTDVGP